VYNVHVSGAPALRRFFDGVGGFGPRQDAVLRLSETISEAPNTNVDTLPREVFAYVTSSIAERGLTMRQMAGLRGTSYGGKAHTSFAPSRAVMASYARLLEDDLLCGWAESDVSWDSVVSIQEAGEEEVFDLTVPGTHSWLADGVVNHNSGAIEQDADVVMFIDRNTDPRAAEDDGERRPPKGEAEVIVAKHRNGPTGHCSLVYLEQYTRFTGMAPPGR
jgi:replicative DNA helicase